MSVVPRYRCSEETYMRLTGERNYALISVVLGKDISEASVNRIFDLADGNLINDNREEKAMSTVLIGCSDLQHTVFLRLFLLLLC